MTLVLTYNTNCSNVYIKQIRCGFSTAGLPAETSTWNISEGEESVVDICLRTFNNKERFADDL